MTANDGAQEAPGTAAGVEGDSITSSSSRMPRPALGAAVVVACVGLVLDQGTKALASSLLHPGPRIPLIGDLLGLSLVMNPGAAFSIGSGAAWAFAAVGVLAVTVTIGFAARLRGVRWGILLGLVLGGAVGNLVDRLANPPSAGQGPVTDFIAYGDLFIGNVADLLVVTGVALLALAAIRSTSESA